MTDTDTPALLPPDPDRPGRYWLRPGQGPDVMGIWKPDRRHWDVEAWGLPATTSDLHECGYTLAIPHPIPGPAALEALHLLWGELETKRHFACRYWDDAVLAAKAEAYAEARDMLRAALEDRE